MKDTPLTITVDDSELVIRIGVDTLKCAFERADFNNPFDENRNDFVQQDEVTDPNAFAKGVKDALCDEAEDGSTPLTRLMDQMFCEAIEAGCEGVEERTEEQKGQLAEASRKGEQ